MLAASQTNFIYIFRFFTSKNYSAEIIILIVKTF